MNFDNLIETRKRTVQDIVLIIVFVIVGSVLLLVSIMLGKKIREERVSFKRNYVFVFLKLIYLKIFTDTEARTIAVKQKPIRKRKN